MFNYVVVVVGAVPEIILRGVGGNFFGLLRPQDMQKGTNAHPHGKSEYQLPHT